MLSGAYWLTQCSHTLPNLSVPEFMGHRSTPATNSKCPTQLERYLAAFNHDSEHIARIYWRQWQWWYSARQNVGTTRSLQALSRILAACGSHGHSSKRALCFSRGLSGRAESGKLPWRRTRRLYSQQIRPNQHAPSQWFDIVLSGMPNPVVQLLYGIIFFVWFGSWQR